MRLSSFIADHRDAILKAWEQDAMNRMPDRLRADVAQLRDHLGELLDAIARDLEAAVASRSSSGGDKKAVWKNVEALGAKHGEARAHQGITITEMVPEFPALRFSASHLWLESLHEVPSEHLADLVRFDEAIDYALMRSVDEFVERLNRSRETFLGVLGHDLRDPLSTIITGARFLIEENTDEAATREMAHRILATGERMHQLIADLLDFTQTRLGRPMPIERRKTDLAGVVRNVADEFATAHPDRPLRMDVAGDLTGQWDAKRMSQAVSNLVGNAIHHGVAGSPVDVSVKADDKEVAILVHNEGAIPIENKAHLFEPMSPANADKAGARRSKHLGLGLYIAQAIVSGHGGRIDVDSTPERGTTFTIHVPRQPEGEAAVEAQVAS